MAGFPDLISFRTLFFPDLIFISSHPRFWRRPAAAKFPDLISFRTLFLSGPYFLFWPPSESGSPAGCGAGRAHQREIVLPRGFPDLILIRTLFFSGPYFFPYIIFASGL